MSSLSPSSLLGFLCLAVAVAGAYASLGAGSSSQREAGILYEVWHSQAADTMRKVALKGGQQLTVETVIRSNGTLFLSDVYEKYGLNGDIYNVQPQLGFYCLYRKRANEENPPIADCDNITHVLTTHAKWILDAGFDYIVVDLTNWPIYDASSILWVIRATEVLFEEWLQLRQQGIATPKIALWPCSPTNATTWRYLLDTLYNNPTYSDLIYTRQGKPLVFLPENPSCYSPSEEQLIQSNGGRNNVVTQRMWALFGHRNYESGSWGFFSPCRTTGCDDCYTTSMVDAQDCNQNGSMGMDSATNTTVVEVSASGGYMVSQCSLPFAAPGKLRGLTVARLFKKVLTTGAPYLFISSFNEHIGGRQDPAYTSNIAFNMGLPNDPGRVPVWVDTYGSEFSRDVEPSIEGGDRIWQVLSSCVHLYKASLSCDTLLPHLIEDNPCCSTVDKNIFTNIWSLYLGDSVDNGRDYLLTNSLLEKDTLLTQGWREICHGIQGPSVFCVSQQNDGRSGSFMMYKISQGINVTQPLYRCLKSNTAQSSLHFLSLDSNCEGATVEGVLGHMAIRRGGEMLRGLRRCRGRQQGVLLHSLDLSCDVDDSVTMGYVR